MQETSNLKLKTYDFGIDDTPDFVRGVAGSSDSNMHIIDEAMHNKNQLDGVGGQNFNFICSEDGKSVKELEVSDGITPNQKLLLSTDSNHVKMATGRTLEEDYTSLLKQHAKEFTSTGEPIEVANGIKGKVLSATITGDTKLYKALKGTEEWEEIPSSETRDTVTYDYKLDSTQCILNNNGASYPIYATEEDKANKKVILLPFVEDKLTLNEDGSGTWIKASKKDLVINSYVRVISQSDTTWGIEFTSQAIYKTSTTSQTIFSSTIENLTLNKITSNPWEQASKPSQVEYLSVWDSKKIVGILLKSKYGSTESELKSKLLEIPVVASVMLDTPIATTIPKELIPTIQTTDKINTLSVESAVAPSEFKVSVPVDRIGEIQAELDEIKAIIQAPSNMSLSMNYIDDEYTKNTNKESELI